MKLSYYKRLINIEKEMIHFEWTNAYLQWISTNLHEQYNAYNDKSSL